MLSKNKLREIRSLHLKKFRDAQGMFIAEGAKMVGELLHSHPGLIDTIYGGENFMNLHSEALKRNNTRQVIISEEELKSISLLSTPNQVLAVCRKPGKKEEDHGTSPFTFYLDDIRDPGNFGTILRICDWFGVREIFCSAESCELYNPKVIQSSMGAFLRVHVNYVPLKELLRRRNFNNVYATVLEGDDIYRTRLEGGLILIGNEANGIAPENMLEVTRRLTIPAHSSNGSESLNAAMATAMVCGEFYRQLRAPAQG